MSLVQTVRRDDTVSWTLSSALVAASAAPSLSTDGTAIGGGAGMVQWGTHTLSSVTDYSVRIWGYAGTGWQVLEEHTGCGAVARGWETALTSWCSRYYVQLSAITGTSLKLQYRQV